MLYFTIINKLNTHLRPLIPPSTLAVNGLNWSHKFALTFDNAQGCVFGKAKALCAH